MEAFPCFIIFFLKKEGITQLPLLSEHSNRVYTSTATWDLYDTVNINQNKAKRTPFLFRVFGTFSEETHQRPVHTGETSHLTLHAVGPPGEQFGLGDLQIAPGPTLFGNL